MSEFEFTDAVRQAIPALIAISGPSGSGKTYTALQLAAGLANGGTICAIDTENNRMRLYASDFTFKHLPLRAPYDPKRFIEAIDAGVKAGAEVIVLDSCTPEWDGEGGVQQIVDKAMARFKDNKFAAWSVATPKHQAFLDALTHCSVHLIVTVRAKMGYEQVGNKINKLGLQPIQRPNFEYEFPFWFDINSEHQLIVTRSCWSEISDQVYTKPGPDLGAQIGEWLDSGAEPVEPREAPAQDALSNGSVDSGGESLVEQIQLAIPDHPKVRDGSVSNMTDKQLDALIKSQPDLKHLEVAR